MRDPYAVLGLKPDADETAIRRAFRAEAKRLHPDLNPDNAAAQQAFQDLTEAYALLSDPLARARWHAERNSDGGPLGRFGWESLDGKAKPRDPLGDLFGEAAPMAPPADGEDVTYRLTLPLLAALAASRQPLRLAGEREVEVSVPAGVEDGEILRLPGAGLPGRSGGAPGDALVEIALTPDPRFRRQGADLHSDLAVSLNEAVNGGSVPVGTAHGLVTLAVPPGSNSGTRLRLKNRGLPDRQGGWGHHYLHLTVVLPDPPDAALAAFLRRWSAEHPYNPRGDASGGPAGEPDQG